MSTDNGWLIGVPYAPLKMQPWHFPLSAARRRTNWRRFEVRPVNDARALGEYAQDAQAYIAALHHELERLYAVPRPLGTRREPPMSDGGDMLQCPYEVQAAELRERVRVLEQALREIVATARAHQRPSGHHCDYRAALQGCHTRARRALSPDRGLAAPLEP